MDDDLEGKQFDRQVNQTIWERWRGVMIEDKENEDKEPDEIRALFSARDKELTKESNRVGRSVCLVIDEEVLRSLINADESGSFLTVRDGGAFLKLVDVNWVA